MINRLRDIDAEEFLHRFPIVLNQLLMVMTRSADAATREEAFKTFIFLLHRCAIVSLCTLKTWLLTSRCYCFRVQTLSHRTQSVAGSRDRNCHLSTYVNYVFDNVYGKASTYPMYEELCFQWMFIMKQKVRPPLHTHDSQIDDDLDIFIVTFVCIESAAGWY